MYISDFVQQVNRLRVFGTCIFGAYICFSSQKGPVVCLFKINSKDNINQQSQKRRPETICSVTQGLAFGLG